MQPSKNIWDNGELVKVLAEGGVAVMPTDTIYGMVGKAENERVVERIYTIRKRAPGKPCIILIGDIKELEKFSIHISVEQKKALAKYWSSDSSPTSIVLDCLDKALSYLHRGTKTLAFRMPASEGLRGLLLKTGPLIAPSANLEALPLSQDISEAKEYFGGAVDLYIDGGLITTRASRVIRLHTDGSVDVLR